MHDDYETGGVLRLDAPPGAAGARLDAFLAGELAGRGVSRARVQELIREGKALVDGGAQAKPGFRLAGGEALELALDIPAPGLTPRAGVLDLVHEDEALVVVDKPAGLVVHPGPGIGDDTLVHRLAHRFPGILDMGGERPGVVHRIDKDTSGLLLVALTEAARLRLSEDFAERRIEKEYLALVHGVPAGPLGGQGSVDAPIGRDPRVKTRMAVTDKGGRAALTDWRVLWIAPDASASLVRVRIHTGRTHQIRVHMAHIGHPLLGDAVYGAREQAEWRRGSGLDPALASRQMLHAWRLAFVHPLTGERLEFCSEPPEDFRTLALELLRSVQRVGLVGMPGSGKSALAGMLADAGAPVFSADACVAGLYDAGADGWVLMRRRFGPEFAPDGRPVDKARLFAAMCESDALRREVQDLVHPLVRHRVAEFWREHRHAVFAVAEVQLLLEGGWPEDGLTDLVVGVRVPEAARRERLAGRGWAPEVGAAMESWQWSEADKMARCDLVVDNDGDLDALRRKASDLVRELAARRETRQARTRAHLESLWAAPEGDG
ncbi:dephospho-CoA kinase [Desulfocurvus sp. DL9XJH121]